MKHYILFLFSLVTVCLFSCSDESDNTQTTPPVDTLGMIPDTVNTDSIAPVTSAKRLWNFSTSDEKVIAMPEKLQMGVSYKTIETILPDFKGVRAEDYSADMAEKGYVEGMSETTLFGKKASCTFHFKKDSLYSYDVSVPIIDMKEAEKKYNEIKNYYTNKYGAAQAPRVEEDNYTSTTSYWETPKGYLVLRNDLSTGTIEFGLHNAKPE